VSAELYKIGMLDETWWASACEIEAASQLLSCTIHIFLKGKSKNGTISYTETVYGETDHVQQTIYLLLSNEHFSVLEHVPGTDSEVNTFCTFKNAKPLETIKKGFKSSQVSTQIKSDKSSQGSTKKNLIKKSTINFHKVFISITHSLHIQTLTKNHMNLNQITQKFLT
jgi:hypothetical protein